MYSSRPAAFFLGAGILEIPAPYSNKEDRLILGMARDTAVLFVCPLHSFHFLGQGTEPRCIMPAGCLPICTLVDLAAFRDDGVPCLSEVDRSFTVVLRARGSAPAGRMGGR
ncbi:hypothetical protein TRIP_B330064 [uncultured Desulfatiglans sp.]|uniref:Uncharacterized protein n=1 Tax=Uncultured Desulfatiglans sp. TaxID=1748965 RepID=A0A653A7B0_UNCDX|nr:hypothetical protein TRIP_B330064 [uncultured Desulfatiglans sp.]